METNELKNIWETLANEKIIGKKLADENIERIISLKSSKTIEKLHQKLKFDYIVNMASAIFIVLASIFVTIFNKFHNHVMPIEAYLFLFLTFVLCIFKSLSFYSKIKLLKSSKTTSTIKDSLINAKRTIENTNKRENYIISGLFVFIVILGNVLLNENTDFKNFNLNSLQGYALIFSVLSLTLGSFIYKIIFRKRFSEIMKNITASLNELEEN